MEFDDIERLFYNDFKVFQRPRTPEENEMTQSTAHWINRMAGMPVFDEDAISSLTKMTDNEQLERYFFFLLNQVFLRDEELAKLKDKYSFHIIVSDFREICTNIIEKDAVIVLEWQYIKYMDMLNSNILYAKSLDEFSKNIEEMFRSFSQKYRDRRMADKNQRYHANDNPVFFRLGTYIQNIQEIFILGHELGHILFEDSARENTEQGADLMGLQTVLNYCKHNEKIICWVIISIELLFTYMTWLDAFRERGASDRKKVIDGWMERYDALFLQLEPYYNRMTENEQKLVDYYDTICNKIFEIGLAEAGVVEESIDDG